MGLMKKASLLLYFLIFLHLVQSISPSSPSLATVDPNHDNLPLHAVDSKSDGDIFAGNLRDSVVVVRKGSSGGGRSFGGGGGRSSGGGGGRSSGGGGRRGFGGGGVRPIPFYGGGLAHGGHHRSSSDREIASGWLGLSALVGLVLVL